MTEQYIGDDCQTDGGAKYECTYCGDSYITDGGLFGDHDYVYINGEPGTCQTEAWEEYECSVCGDSYTWYGDYDFDNHVQLEIVNAFSGTCVDQSYEEYVCAACGGTVTYYGDYGDHDWDYDSGTCSYCDATLFAPSTGQQNSGSGLIIKNITVAKKEETAYLEEDDDETLKIN